MVELVLGIDLGTSCSKVVIGDPGWKGANFAVPSDGDTGTIAGWLHPTQFGSEKNLKMRLMDNPESVRLQHLLACCLAEIIRRARDWFVDHAPSDYARCDLQWRVNVGFPEKTVGHSPLADAYRTVAKIAGRLARQRGPITLERARKIRKETGGCKKRASYPVELYPEIAAQLAGYVHSPFRKGGNLLLIDVGAGTLDVSTVILHECGGEQIVSFQVCDVKELGALRLYEERLRSLNLGNSKQSAKAVSRYQNGCEQTPSTVEDILDKPSHDQKAAFERTSVSFGEQIMGTILSCLVRFRKNLKDAHDKRGIDPWGDTLRFFLTGGGARSAFYKTRVAGGELEERLIPFTRWDTTREKRRLEGQGLRSELLPVPADLRNLPAALHDEFDRISVAYGLAFGGENLMGFTQ